MKKLVVTAIGLALLCSALSGCIVVPERPGPYYGGGYGGCYHCWH